MFYVAQSNLNNYGLKEWIITALGFSLQADPSENPVTCCLAAGPGTSQGSDPHPFPRVLGDSLQAKAPVPVQEEGGEAAGEGVSPGL